MKFMMATEAQRLISISLAKIAASRCVRGGVSLHKNLLVATVLQKARYIFMEEAFHTLHGHYINQANSKFIQQLRYQEQLENQLRQQHDKEYGNDEDDDSTLDDSELDLFSSSMDSSESLNFLSESENNNVNCNKGNPSLASTSTTSTNSSSSSSSSDHLIYLDLDVNRMRSSQHEQQQQNGNSIISGQKRRLSSDEYDSEDSLLSIFPTKSKQIRYSSSDEDDFVPVRGDSNSNNITTDNCLSLDFLSNDLHLTSDHHQQSCNTSTTTSVIKQTSTTTTTATANVTMAPLDLDISNSTSALSSSSCSSVSSPSSSSSSSSIDRITSLVSIFNFGNLQRSVSTPDLCSSSSNHHHHHHHHHHSTVENSCCNLQRQIAMTV